MKWAIMNSDEGSTYFKESMIEHKPTDIIKISEGEAIIQQRIFRKLVELRSARVASGVDSVEYKLDWPSYPLISRVIPEGIMPLDSDTSDDHDIRLEKFFKKESVRQLVFWGIGYEHLGMFKSRYYAEMRSWIKSYMIVSPIVLIAEYKDILLIANDQLHFSVIGGGRDAISSLESSFGGSENLKAIFNGWINEGGGPFWRRRQTAGS